MRLFITLAGALSAILAVLLLLPFSQSSDQLDARVEGDVLVLVWTGPIDPPMANALSTTVRKHRSSTSKVLLNLDSPGGSVLEGEDVINVLERVKRSHQLFTHVGTDSECLSMCVPIYLSGTHRSAASTSVFMFHEAYAVDPAGNPIFEFSGDKRAASSIFFHRFFRRSEMDQQWADKLEIEMIAGEVWKTGRELQRERSNIVLQVRNDALVN